MIDPQHALGRAVQRAAGQAFGPEYAEIDPVIRVTANPTFGHYQSNVAMGLAKQVGKNPREVAEAIVSALDCADMLQGAPTIAGPGFINFMLSPRYVASVLDEMAGDERLGAVADHNSEVVVLDYSAPNVAKEMHVGHLRTTIIGDALARVLAFLGDTVSRQNHVGDWGTQFGMLIEHLFATYGEPLPEPLPHIDDLNAMYKQASSMYKDDEVFAERARRRVVELQSGRPEVLRAWHALIAESERHYEDVYNRLGVLLTHDDIRGESAYNDLLDDVCLFLEERKLARIDDGALCAYPPGFANREGEPLGFIIRKREGGYLYATTDLAAIRFRAQELHGQRLVYVTDARQGQHFAMVYAIAEQAGWIGGETGVRAQHAPTGMVLGDDGTPLKSRSGDVVRLVELLDEAVERAQAVVDAKSSNLSPEERHDVARAVGIGAMKYADLSSQRNKNYVFAWDRLLAMEGNTAPYLQYAHARIQSMLRKADPADVAARGPLALDAPAEMALALQLVRFGDAVRSVGDTLEPHLLCTYLFETAQAFTAFYESCSVLNAETDAARRSRLALCALTASVLATGLGLLGIRAPERL